MTASHCRHFVAPIRRHSYQACSLYCLQGNALNRSDYCLGRTRCSLMLMRRRSDLITQDKTCTCPRWNLCNCNVCLSNCVFIYSKAKDMQQMVKLEEEMDRRPATVVWATETETQVHTHTHTQSYTHTCRCRNTPSQIALYNPKTHHRLCTFLSCSHTNAPVALLTTQLLHPHPTHQLYTTEPLGLFTVWRGI